MTVQSRKKIEDDDKEVAAWPGGLGAGLENQWFRVPGPLWQPVGLVPSSPRLNFSAMLEQT